MIEPLIFRLGVMCGLVVMSSAVYAKTAYVTDRLQLGVHAQADTSDRAFTKIMSGDRVEISEENLYHARVKIPDGRTGWVKKNYLVTDAPAIVRVTEVELERDKAIGELESMTSGLSEREARVGEIEAQTAAREAESAGDAEELKRLRVENSGLTDRLASYEFSVPGALFFLATAASLVIGFLASWWWFDQRSRMRHGGFRIR